MADHNVAVAGEFAPFSTDDHARAIALSVVPQRIHWTKKDSVVVVPAMAVAGELGVQLPLAQLSML